MVNSMKAGTMCLVQLYLPADEEGYYKKAFNWSDLIQA